MDQTYEYQTIKVPLARAGRGARKRRDKILNQRASEGWEVASEQPKPTFAIGRHDLVTLRRPVS